MWPDPRNGRNDILQIYCPKCNELCENSCFELTSHNFNRECQICNNAVRIFRCKQSTCEYYVKVCPKFCTKSLTLKSIKKNEQLKGCRIDIKKNISCLTPIYLVGVLIMIVASWSIYKFGGTRENEDKVTIEKLRRAYPLQKNETWYHFLGVLEKGIPSVKSIIFLHGIDKATTDCLINELVLLHTKNINLKSEDITFSDFEVDDYGFLLQHYHSVVQKFGVFITDLNKVSSKVARIFHSLCDEVSSDVKPSLFIFTLKFDERTELLKPIERATVLLKKNWDALPHSELFPLLSRVVKNVVDVVPEHKIKC